MALVTRVLVVSLVGARLPVDDSWFAKELRVAHLARHWNLLDDASVHGLGLVVGGHRDVLLWAHVRLLLVLVHLLATAATILAATLVRRSLAKLEHAVGIRAVVLVRAGLTSAEVLADHCLMVFEVLTALWCCVVSTLVATLASTASTTPTRSSHTLEFIVFPVNLATHVTAATTRGTHATAAAPAAHTIVLLIVATSTA